MQDNTARRIIAFITTFAGILLIAGTLVSDQRLTAREVPGTEALDLFAWLGGLIALAACFVRNPLLPIGQAIVATLIGVRTAWQAFGSGNVSGPAFTTLLMGASLLLVGAYMFVGAHRAREVATSLEPDPDGRRFVYENNRVVAIEHWKEGRLIAREPFTPKIAR